MVRKIEAVLHYEVVVRYKTIDNTERSCCSMIARLNFEGWMKDCKGRVLMTIRKPVASFGQSVKKLRSKGWKGKKRD